MFDLFVTSDIARGLIEKSLELNTDSPMHPAKKRIRRRRRGLRSVSAAALRGVADRLETSPSA